jgi:[acyl-carrier-protein] S-malonyltransferase
MLAELAETAPVVGQTFDEASETLGYDLWALTHKGPEASLNQTEVTQPAMLTAGVAVYRTLVEAASLNPAYMAGHSLGEYTALVASGALSLAQGVELVEARGRLMQEAVPAGTGAMAAVLGLEDEQIIALCAESDGILEAVNFNAPGQVVIAGEKTAVDQALPAFEAAGAKRVVPLPVSVPSHCVLMKPAAEALAEKLAGMTLQTPEVPVVHNASVQTFAEPDAIKAALVEQLYRPVQWVRTIEYLKAQGVSQLYELGPGKVLMGLNRRIDRKMGMQAVYDSATLSKALETL